MLRQLARLTRPLPAISVRACAPAVYADSDDSPLPARDKGFEGVACIDDAARALVLLCDLWEATRLPELRQWALGSLDFVLHLQQPDGAFANFVRDWNGTPNLTGDTSVPGGAFWQARAVRGVVRAWRALGDKRAERAAALAFARRDAPASSDVLAVRVLAAIEAGREYEAMCDEIAACRHGDVLLDVGHQHQPHEWGHIHEGVLAFAATRLHRPDLLEIARRSAEAVIVPLVESAFDRPMVQPYGVACAAYDMDQLAVATGEARYRELAALARAWFDGRNSAHAPAYDRDSGRVADGIDGGSLNPHSGAESNIVGAQALLDEVAAALRTLPRDRLLERLPHHFLTRV